MRPHALPWLVLRMTGDTAALGLVLAFIGVPRALFILVGGAVVDRFSPYRVLMVTKHVNAALLATLVLGVYLRILPLPALYALALALGVSSAFSIPSGTSMLPHALRPQFLAAANSVMMGLRQLSFFIGPMAAGLLIALFGDGSGTVHQPTGIALAFSVDAASFALSAWTLSRVRLHAAATISRGGSRHPCGRSMTGGRSARLCEVLCPRGRRHEQPSSTTSRRRYPRLRPFTCPNRS